MDIKQLILKNRSYRRFDESHLVNYKELESFIDLARLSASAANRQPLKYVLYNTPEDCEKIFPLLAWAGYLSNWGGPVKGERPSAYIIILGDKTITEGFGIDHGIAAQSIMLGASEIGLGGCMIASFRKTEMRSLCRIPDNLELLLVLAIGKPVENVIIDDVSDNNIKYWRDEKQNHHVPKRSLKELIVKF
jgi:nitroreductase